MARTPNHKALSIMVQYYISMYYHNLRMKSEIPTYQDKIEVSEQNNKNYLHQLENNYKDWNTEESREAVINEVDYLTGIYTRKRDDESKLERQAEMRKRFQ